MPQGYSKDPYAILGLPTTATASQVKEAYRRLARQYHPDLNKDLRAAERMKDINWAHDILSDPHERSRYDLWRSAGARVDPAPRTNPPPPNTAAPSNRNNAWQEVKKAHPAGWSAIALFWLVMMVVRTLSQANQSSYVTNPSSFANAQTLDAILQESLYLPLTMTAMGYSFVSPDEQTQDALFKEYSPIPTDSTPSLTLIDIRDQVTPGSQAWEWINTLLADHQLTTSRGLSNEVTRVRRDRTGY
jgi:curved DNA-binding protein CbpA